MIYNSYVEAEKRDPNHTDLNFRSIESLAKVNNLKPREVAKDIKENVFLSDGYNNLGGDYYDTQEAKFQKPDNNLR